MLPTCRSLVSAALLLLLSHRSFAQTYGNTSTVSNVSTSACPSPGGAHFIVARASLEPPGYGVIGAVKDIILSRVPGSTAEAVAYPATLADYFNSESAGVAAMQALVAAFLAKCADTPLVLMGYSQGAQVTMDVLAGQQDAAFPPNASLAMPPQAAVLARVAAAVVMGDPSFNLTESSFHVGNASKNGVYPRHDVTNLEAGGLAARIRSYCDAGDPYCAGGSFDNLSVHLGYVNEYRTQAADFVVMQIKDWYANGTSNSSSSTGGGANSTSTGSSGRSNGTSSNVTASTGSAASGGKLSDAGMASTVAFVLVGGFLAYLL